MFLDNLFEPIVDNAGRNALKNYQYKSNIYSFLDTKVGTPFWEYVVTFVPMSIAPNTITFVATLTFLMSFLIFQYYVGGLEGCAPSWVYYNLSICLFIYQTLDAIDGKQARRTKSSSPLGQLFDHGNDAFATTPMVVAGLGCAQFGHSWLCLSTLLAGYVVFYMLNYRARHVGYMNFGYFSVTEAQVMGMIIYGITGLFGCNIWLISFGHIYHNKIIIDLRTITTFFMIMIALYTSFGEWKEVEKYYKKTRTPDGGRYIELIQLSTFIIFCVSWNLNDVFSKYPRTFIWTLCLIFSGLIHRLIIADVTRMKTKWFHNLLVPLPIVTILSLLEYNGFNMLSFVGKWIGIKQLNITHPLIVYGLFTYIVIAWSVFCIRVINEITETLNVQLFAINKPNRNTHN